MGLTKIYTQCNPQKVWGPLVFLGVFWGNRREHRPDGVPCSDMHFAGRDRGPAVELAQDHSSYRSSTDLEEVLCKCAGTNRPETPQLSDFQWIPRMSVASTYGLESSSLTQSQGSIGFHMF